MIVEMIHRSKLDPAYYNPRKIDADTMLKLAQSINEFGFVQPILANKNGRIIGGHQRYEAAGFLEMEYVPVTYIDLPEEKEKLLNIALNKISGDWDHFKLKDLLQELDNGENDILLTGFNEQELESMMTFIPDPEDLQQYVNEKSKDKKNKPQDVEVEMQCRYTLWFPQEAAFLVKDLLDKLKAELPELKWKEGTAPVKKQDVY